MECKICGKKFDDLRPHLRKHKIHWREYQDIYGVNPGKSMIIPVSEKDRVSGIAYFDSIERAKVCIGQS